MIGRALVVALVLVPACKAEPLECPLANAWSAGDGDPHLEELLLDRDGRGQWNENLKGQRENEIGFGWQPVAKGVRLTIDGEDRVVGFRVETEGDSCVLHLERPPVEPSHQRRFEAPRRKR